MKQRNPKALLPPLNGAEALPFMDLAWAPDWAPPFLENWRGAESEAREAVIEGVIADQNFLKLSAKQRADALSILCDARDMAWKLDLEGRGIATNRARLEGQKKAPGFQKARKAFRAVVEMFGEAPFPFFAARGNLGLGPHAEMTEAAHEFLDAALKSFPAIGLEFQDLTRTRTRNFSRAPRAPYQSQTKRRLHEIGLSRANVSRLLFAVRLVSKLSAKLRTL